MPSFSCPKCKKVLKTSTLIPAGRKVKCPGCSHIFSMPALEEKTAVRSTEPVVPARSPAAISKAEEERSKRTRPDPDEEEDASRKSSRRARARDDDDDPDEDEEDDDRPSRRRRRKKKAGGKLTLILAVSGAAVLVLALVIAAFVWPGFLVAGSKTGPVDLFAILPANADIVWGANRPGQLKLFQMLMKSDKDVSPEEIDLFMSADRIVGGIDGQPRGLTVTGITSLAPWDVEKVKKAFKAGPAIKFEGRIFYKVGKAAGAGRALMTLANDKTVVVASLTEPEFSKIFEAKSPLSPEMQSHVNTLNQKSLWGVVNLQGKLKTQMQPQLDMMALMQPESAPFWNILKRSKSISLSLAAPRDTFVQIELHCLQEQDATEVETQGKNLWEQQGKPALAAAPLLLGKMPGAKGVTMLASDLGNSLKFQRQGTQLSVSATIAENTIAEMENQPPPLEMFGAVNPGGVNPPPKKGRIIKKR